MRAATTPRVAATARLGLRGGPHFCTECAPRRLAHISANLSAIASGLAAEPVATEGVVTTWVPLASDGLVHRPGHDWQPACGKRGGLGQLLVSENAARVTCPECRPLPQVRDHRGAMR